MRRLTAALVVVLIGAALLFSSCKRRSTAQDAPQEVPANLVAAFAVNDPNASVQMTRGFYALEGNSWRWTAPQFAVVLAPPEGAPDSGAKLEFKFTIPDVVFTKTGAVTLSAKVDGQALPPETFSTSGEHVYTRDLPPAAFGKSGVAIDFSTDKSLPPSGADTRELALIATSVGLTAK